MLIAVLAASPKNATVEAIGKGRLCVKRALVVAMAVVAAAPVASRQSPAVGTRDFSNSTVIDDSPGPGAFVGLGDLDQDGDLDLVLAKGRHVGGSSRLLINDGAGQFTSQAIGVPGDRSYGAVVADVDGDGHLDIVLSNELGLSRVLLNDGRAGFTHDSDWGNRSWPTRMADLADLNGDRHLDVIAPIRDPRRGTPSAYCLNDGRGRFASCSALPFLSSTTIVAADFNRDGHIDLAAPHRDGGQSAVAYNDGQAGFERASSFGPSTMAARSAAAGDLNKDGWPDLVVGDDVMGIVIFLNDGHGSLGELRQVNLREVVTVNALAIADVNGDGSLDIVAGYSSRLPARAPGSVLYNDGTGLAYLHSRFGDGAGNIYGLAVADLNGDGHPDLTAARSAAASTVHLSHPGGRGVAVATSSTPVSPVPLFEPRPPDETLPIAGVWAGAFGASGAGDETEVLIERTGEAIVGRRVSHTSGIVVCVSSLALKERRSGAEYIFTETPESGFCLGNVIRVQQDALGSVRVDVYFEPQASATSKPNRSGLFKRKR